MTKYIIHLRELFSNVNVDSIKEVLPKISMYNDTVARYIEDINLRYGITLSYMHLEVSEIGHWTETFQVATYSNNHPEPYQPQQPPQPQQQTLQVTTTSPQVQVPTTQGPTCRNRQVYQCGSPIVDWEAM